MDTLRRHSWPGNLRELESILKQAILHTTGPVLAPDFLPPLSSAPDRTLAVTAGLDWRQFVETRLSQSENLYADALEAMERHLLTRVLQHTAGNQVQAARILGITRGSLRTKIRALNITIERSVWSNDDQAG